jgi:apolipoprotein N-acyltransferase
MTLRLRMLKINFPAAFGLATLSGCLWFLAVTPFDFAALAWIAALPMLLAIDRAPTFRQALVLGGWAGMVETAGGFYWLIDVTRSFRGGPRRWYYWRSARRARSFFCSSPASSAAFECGAASR